MSELDVFAFDWLGDTLFNVPTKSFRVKYQAHSGPQERVDLAVLYPSLAPPERIKHVSAEEIDSAIAFWEEALRLDPAFDPARESRDAALAAKGLKQTMSELQKIKPNQ